MADEAQYLDLIHRLESLACPETVDCMAHFGIRPARALGIPMKTLQAIAKELGRNHALAARLWQSGIHDARILACLIADPAKFSEQQIEEWVSDFDSWDICDQCCMRVFDKTPNPYRRAMDWSLREETFVRRAGFTLMAVLAVHDKKADDSEFKAFFPFILEGANDARNFVKKAVSWALRQIGKRNPTLLFQAIDLAATLKASSDSTARWVGSDAYRELSRRLERVSP